LQIMIVNHRGGCITRKNRRELCMPVAQAISQDTSVATRLEKRFVTIYVSMILI